MAAARVVITGLIYNPVAAEPCKISKNTTILINPVIQKRANGFVSPFLFCLDFSHLDKIRREESRRKHHRVKYKRRDVKYWEQVLIKLLRLERLEPKHNFKRRLKSTLTLFEKSNILFTGVYNNENNGGLITFCNILLKILQIVYNLHLTFFQLHLARMVSSYSEPSVYVKHVCFTNFTE